MGKAAVEQRFGDQQPGRAKDACGRGENISGAGKGGDRRKIGAALCGTPVCAWSRPRLKGLALRVVLRHAVRCGAHFFCTVVFGQRQQRGGLLGVLPGTGGRCRRFRPSPALPRRLPRDAERMRAAEELRLFADLWTHAATPLVSVPASLASDSAFPAPGRGLIGTGCPSLESDSALWTRTRRFRCLRQAVPSWHRTRLFCLPVFFFGVWHSSCGRASSAAGAALWNRRTVPGIRFRVPGFGRRKALR